MAERCEWGSSEEMKVYHDKDWGVPVHEDKILFEMLILEGAQAGLNWLTVLKKRENYRKAFDEFDFEKVAKYDDKKIGVLLGNAGIIRNRLKINSSIRNAKVFLEIREEFGSFDKYIWGFVGGQQIINKFKSLSELPAKTGKSDEISEDLKKRGMNFVGSTIMYAYMQSVGMVNDHVVNCFRWGEVQASGGKNEA
jgi:DNA-3-methyladenine glycosylase I